MPDSRIHRALLGVWGSGLISFVLKKNLKVRLLGGRSGFVLSVLNLQGWDRSCTKCGSGKIEIGTMSCNRKYKIIHEEIQTYTGRNMKSNKKK